MEVFMKNVRKIDWLQVVSKIVAALGLTILVCICGMSASCKVSPEGIEILEPEYTKRIGNHSCIKSRRKNSSKCGNS